MLTSLKSRSLEELKKEPWRLQIQADNTAEQLRNLVLKNYHVFIQSNQCAAMVQDNLAELKKETIKIETAIPKVEEDCLEFQKLVGDIVAKNGDIQYIFEHYVPLMELLEIPQLLEACIHNEIFDAALDVIQVANDTFQADEKATAGSHNILIDCLVREVADLSSILREKLLQKLREDLQLALCVRIVGYLRRLDALVQKQSIGSVEYEKQLKDEFLSCRNVWLASLSREIAASDPYQYIVQLIDIKRTSWFDLITQYSAIFGSENVDGKVDPPLCRWATTTVADFLDILRSQVPKIDEFSSIATIFDQSLFFGGSLGRVGVDFRAVLVVSFENHVLQLMTEKWRKICREFHDNLAVHAFTKASSRSISTIPLVVPSYRLSSEKKTASGAAEAELCPLLPPRILLTFPLLADVTNAFLSSLNDLRLCTISSLRHRLRTAYHRAIGTLILTFVDFVKENKLDLDAVSEEVNNTLEEDNGKQSKTRMLTDSVRAMIQVLHAELVPYLLKCFHRLFPSASAATALSKDMETFHGLMQEAGLLIRPAEDDENEKKAAVEKEKEEKEEKKEEKVSDSIARDESVNVIDTESMENFPSTDNATIETMH